MGFVFNFYVPSILFQREDNRENVIVQICSQCSGVIEKCGSVLYPYFFIFCYYCRTENTLISLQYGTCNELSFLILPFVLLLPFLVLPN
jgi:hypothetical protein